MTYQVHVEMRVQRLWLLRLLVCLSLRCPWLGGGFYRRELLRWLLEFVTVDYRIRDKGIGHWRRLPQPFAIVRPC